MAIELFASACEVLLRNLQEIEICIHGTKRTNTKSLVTLGLAQSFFLPLKCFIIGSCTVFKSFQSDLQKSPRNCNWYTWCQGYKYQHFGNLEVGSNFLTYFSIVL